MKVCKVSNIPQFDPDEIKDVLTIEQLLDGIETTSASNGELKCLCPLPGHEGDTNPSFNFGDDVFYCHGCNRGGDVIELYMLLYTVDFQEAITKLAIMADVKPMSDINYNYYNEQGELVYRKVRKPNKDFYWDRFENGNWLTGLAGKQPPLYKLVDLVTNPTKAVFIVEGEKDTNTVSGSLGLITTTAGGNAWLADYNKYFEGRDVFVIPDNDNPGRSKANQIALALLPIAREVKIVNLPNLKDKEDVTDWTRGGGTREQLIQLVKDTPLYEPERVTKGGCTLINEAKNNPPVIELIPNVCWGGESTLFYAREKTGKTTFLISSAAAALKQGRKVLWFACPGESSILDVVQRIDDLGYVMTETDNLFFGNSCNYRSFETFASDVEYFQPDIIIIDSLTGVSIDFGEKVPELSDDAGWTEFIVRFTELVRGTPMGIVLIHHTKKSGLGDYRGNAMIGAKVDNMVYMAGGCHGEYTTLKSVLRGRSSVDVNYAYDVLDDRYQLCDVVLSTFTQDLWLYDYLKNPQISDDEKMANIIYEAAKLQGYSRQHIRSTVKRLCIGRKTNRKSCWQVTDKTETVIKEIQEKNEATKEALNKKKLANFPKTNVNENEQF